MTPTASTDFFPPTGTSSVTFSPAPARLADTGMDATVGLIVFAVITVLVGGTILWGRRKGLQPYGGES